MIDTSNWKEFRVGDLFEFESIKQAKSQRAVPDDINGIPYVVQSKYNNMVARYVNKQWLIDNNEPPVKGNTIALGVTLNCVSYQENEFGASQIITARNNNLNCYIGNFVATILTYATERFTYKEKPGLQKYKDTIIKLPATSDGQPDWDYMESYMKAVMEESEKSLENLRKADDTKHLIDVSGWGEFRVGDLLHMEKQIELNPVYAYNNSTDNETLYPFYGQSSENNGIIDYYYLGENLLNNKDAQFCIMIHSNTHLAYCVNTPFYLKDGHGATTIFTNKNLNNMTTYFLISVLNTTMNGNFDYDTKATKERLNDLIVKIPITSTGEPDWQYMEDYMRKIMDKSEQIISDLQIGA